MKGKTRMHNCSHERVKELLDYNPATGIFVWKVNPAKNIKVGSIAGGSGGNGYVSIVVDGEDITTGRLAWFYVTGKWPERRVKYVNGDRSDCRFENLTKFNGIGGNFTFRDPIAVAAYQREYRKATAHIQRARLLRRTFNLSLQEYGEILVAQNGVCAICNQPERTKRNGKTKALSVDHNHETGKIRGLLCHDCNTAIGKLKEDKMIFLSAIRYLEKHAGVERTVVALSSVPLEGAK